MQIMAKCPVCGDEQQSGDFCMSCGSALILNDPHATQTIQNETVEYHSRLYERLILFLFRPKVREDICQREYNLEAIIVWILIYLIYELTVYYNYSYLPITFIIGVNDIAKFFLGSFIQLIIIIFFTSIVGFVGNSELTVNKIFRIYTYSYLSITITQGIYVIFGHLFFEKILNVAPFIPNSIMAIVLPFLLLPIGYTTLFKTNYFSSFIITLIVLFLSLIPLGILAVFDVAI